MVVWMKKNLTFSLIFFLFCLEVGVRLTGMYTTFSEDSKGNFWFEWAHERDNVVYAFPPNEDFEMDIGDTVLQYEINELGYREREMPLRSKPSAQRVFVVGDSFTEGNGSDYDNSWTRRLGARVQMIHPEAEFYVCGISGLDPHYAWASIKKQLLAYKPTHIITTVNDSDFDDQIIRGGYSRFQPDGSVKYRPAPWFLPVYRFSHIVRMLVHEFLDYDYFLIRRNNRETQRAEVADSITQCLLDINKLCIQNEVKFMAVIHPVPHSICYESEVVKSEVFALNSQGFDFSVIRMYQPLKQAMTGPDCTAYHWEQDSHFNAKGYQLFASLLYDKIQEEYPDFWEVNQASVDPVQLLDE
jgi:hypothetical protein